MARQLKLREAYTVSEFLVVRSRCRVDLLRANIIGQVRRPQRNNDDKRAKEEGLGAVGVT